jgi:phage terminase large subunit GpA-like protein
MPTHRRPTTRAIRWHSPKPDAYFLVAAQGSLASTPTINGLSRIEREYEASDQRRFFVPCSALLRDAMAQVRAVALGQGQAGDGGLLLRGLRAPIAEHHKTQMLAAGEWRPATTSAIH